MLPLKAFDALLHSDKEFAAICQYLDSKISFPETGQAGLTIVPCKPLHADSRAAPLLAHREMAEDVIAKVCMALVLHESFIIRILFLWGKTVFY